MYNDLVVGWQNYTTDMILLYGILYGIYLPIITIIIINII